MRKYICLLLAVVTMFTFVACGNNYTFDDHELSHITGSSVKYLDSLAIKPSTTSSGNFGTGSAYVIGGDTITLVYRNSKVIGVVLESTSRRSTYSLCGVHIGDNSSYINGTIGSYFSGQCEVRDFGNQQVIVYGDENTKHATFSVTNNIVTYVAYYSE